MTIGLRTISSIAYARKGEDSGRCTSSLAAEACQLCPLAGFADKEGPCSRIKQQWGRHIPAGIVILGDIRKITLLVKIYLSWKPCLIILCRFKVSILVYASPGIRQHGNVLFGIPEPLSHDNIAVIKTLLILS